MHVHRYQSGVVVVVAPPLRDQRDGAIWREMAPDSGFAGGEFFVWRVFLLLCKWQLVVAAHFMIRGAGAGTAPAREVEARVCTGLALHFSRGTHEPDLVRFKFRRTRTGFSSVLGGTRG